MKSNCNKVDALIIQYLLDIMNCYAWTSREFYPEMSKSPFGLHNFQWNCIKVYGRIIIGGSISISHFLSNRYNVFSVQSVRFLLKKIIWNVQCENIIIKKCQYLFHIGFIELHRRSQQLQFDERDLYLLISKLVPSYTWILIHWLIERLSTR